MCVVKPMSMTATRHPVEMEESVMMPLLVTTVNVRLGTQVKNQSTIIFKFILIDFVFTRIILRNQHQRLLVKPMPSWNLH